MIRNATLKDADIISEIYNHYIKNTVITFKEVGYKFEQWLDVGYWQLSLSRFESDKLRDCL